MLHGKGHIVYGDSYFTSIQTVKALLEHGTYYLGMLKTASAGFPKKYLQSLAWDEGVLRGDTRTVQHEAGINGAQKIIYGHAWNEPGSEGFPKKILCVPVDPHVKQRWMINEDTGSSERITRTVPRTSAIKEYFQVACVVDVHNHLRQGSLAMEDAICTHDWWFRNFCKLHCLENKLPTPPTHNKFIERLTVQLLTNNRAGAPVKNP